MITLLILLILFIGAYSGYKNGIILQLLKAIGYLIVFILALDYYKPLSEILYLFVPYPTPILTGSNPYVFYDESLILTLDLSYYYLISFLLILFIGWIIVRVITQLVSYTVEQLTIPEPLNGAGGAILGFIINYIGVFYILLLLSLIPYDFVQERLSNSFLADSMLTSTPVVSEDNYQRFVLDAHEVAEENRPTMEIQPPAEENNEEPPEGNEE